jgi:hypothetical protein
MAAAAAAGSGGVCCSCRRIELPAEVLPSQEVTAPGPVYRLVSVSSPGACCSLASMGKVRARGMQAQLGLAYCGWHWALHAMFQQTVDRMRVGVMLQLWQLASCCSVAVNGVCFVACLLGIPRMQLHLPAACHSFGIAPSR